MAKLIERVGSQTLVDGKSIDLEELVCVGNDLINVCVRFTGFAGARIEAQELGLSAAKEYGYHYVMIGRIHRNYPIIQEADSTGWTSQTFVATFYKYKNLEKSLSATKPRERKCAESVTTEPPIYEGKKYKKGGFHW